VLLTKDVEDGSRNSALGETLTDATVDSLPNWWNAEQGKHQSKIALCGGVLHSPKGKRGRLTACNIRLTLKDILPCGHETLTRAEATKKYAGPNGCGKKSRCIEQGKRRRPATSE
jgi:hypothetical protein